MRFEVMEHGQQMRFLQRLHATINQEFFKGELQPIKIDVRNLNKTPDSDIWAMYCRANDLEPDRILFAIEFEEYIERQRTQREQAASLFQIMLHEMIHQYCAETGIDDTDHNEQWQQAAAAHGLHSIYKAGTLQEEWLEPIPALYANSFVRIR